MQLFKVSVLGGVLALACYSALWIFGTDPNARWVSEPVAIPLPLPTVSYPDRNQRPYKLISQRPLFSEGRRPWIDSAQSVSEPPVDPGKTPSLKTTVAGTITTPEQKIAFVKDNTSGDVLTLEEGEVFSNENTQWRVHQVGERVVSFLSQEPQAPSKVKLEVGGSSEPIPD